jgi:hypothetical protein
MYKYLPPPIIVTGYAIVLQPVWTVYEYLFNTYLFHQASIYREHSSFMRVEILNSEAGLLEIFNKNINLHLKCLKVEAVNPITDEPSSYKLQPGVIFAILKI